MNSAEAELRDDALMLTSLPLLLLRLLQQLRQLPLPLLRREAQRRHLLLVSSLGALAALPAREAKKHTHMLQVRTV